MILRALSKDPSARYETVIDFAKFIGIPLPAEAAALAAWRARIKQRRSARA